METKQLPKPQPLYNEVFPCNSACGACCKNLKSWGILAKSLIDPQTGICRYLGADNRCQVYEKRPLACRHDYLYNTYIKGLALATTKEGKRPISYQEYLQLQRSMCFCCQMENVRR